MKYQLFLHDWKESEIQGVIDDFWAFEFKYENQLKNLEWIFATYSYVDYSGSAFVLFCRDGKVYEVNGGHCSCYGLEGQWDEEETSLDAITDRLKNGTFGREYDHISDSFVNEFADELIGFLSVVYLEKS